MHSYDGKSNENGKIAIFACSSRFFIHFTAVVARLRRKTSFKTSRLMGDVRKRQQRFSINFSERLEFSSRKIRQQLQIEQGGIIAMAFETAQIHFLSKRE